MSQLDKQLKLEVVKSQALTPTKKLDLLALCNRAYQEDVSDLFEFYANSTHVIAYLDTTMVSHALWVTRWLSYNNGSLLQTAYIELVATEPEFFGQGFASIVMQKLVNEISDFDIGALCPSDPDWYARLGWVSWRGKLFIRKDEGLLSTPDEHVMIKHLPKTPPLDLDGSLSAEWRKGDLW